MNNQVWKAGVYRRGCTWVGFVFACCLCGATGEHAWSQEPIPPTPSTQQRVAPPAQVFAKDLEILSKRLGVAFLAEGEPIPVTKERPAPSLSPNLSQEDAVKEVADYFDYAVLHQVNAYILTKRYSTVDDLPEVTQAECMRGLKAILTILAPFNPKIPKGTLAGEPMADIIHLLSSEQLEKLGKDGLPVSELTAAQHDEVWKLALKFYVQNPADTNEEIYTTLENRRPADLVFQWQTIKNIHAFGYNTRSFEVNDTVFIPISDTNRIMVLPNGGMIEHKLINGLTGAAVASRDPTDPTQLSDTTRQFLDDKDRFAHAITISDVITALNGRAANRAVYKVEAMYAPKHVTLVGADKLSSDALMRSLAAVYGLRLVKNEDGSIVLTHPIVVEAKQLSDLNRALKSAVPAPIYRMLQARILPATKSIADKERAMYLGDYNDQAGARYLSAMEQFRYIAEREVKAQPGGKLSLSHLDGQARSLFAFAEAVTSFSRACWFANRSIPPYIADFDHITLTGGLSRNGKGEQRFSLFFSYLNPQTGKMSRGVGFSNAMVP